MITFFPSFYPDELLYSIFSRYHVYSGFMYYRHTSEDLLENLNANPSIMFLNPMTEEIMNILLKGTSFHELIFNHTMFPYFFKFFRPIVRNEIMREIGAKMAHFPFGKHAVKYNNNRRTKALKYCPLCVIEDREKYGESYYHRAHQINEFSICPIHFCKLKYTNISLANTKRHNFISAEESVDNLTIEYSDNGVEREITEYIFKTFTLPIALDSHIEYGDFYASKLYGSKYLSSRGQQKYMNLLHNDYLEYYKDIELFDYSSRNNIKRLFSSEKHNFYANCLLAKFLKITPEELSFPKLPDVMPYEEYDKKIVELHNSGLNYMQISKVLGGSYDYVKKRGRITLSNQEEFLN